ncbi:MAG TPA: IS200/IS605 family transposase [Ohtaekwangia sp.]|nr:IS200/IS605 family transposase [Ohtaekwangia sp.]
MNHSHTKLWVHAVFATKNGDPLISPFLEARLNDFMFQCFTEMGCSLRIFNSVPDHAHMLFLQSPSRSLSEVIKNVKGSSSHWINQNDFIVEKFAWQTGYGAFSVSESQINRVYHYIANQKQHHQQVNFQDEYEYMIALHGLFVA